MSANTMPARELIVAALAQATTPLTVTELAEEAGVAKSTVGKYLPALEQDGAAVRTRGGRQGRCRLPDHWQAAPTATTEQGTADEVPSPQADSEPDRAESEPSGATHPGHGLAGPAPVQAGADGTGHVSDADGAAPGTAYPCGDGPGMNGTGTGPAGDPPVPATAAPPAGTRRPASGSDEPGAD
ncbi:ArsR/SmtB family transcription factor, partial [Nocardiopsis nanhaiensis]